MLQLNVLARYMKILIDIGKGGGTPMGECSIGKISKSHSSRFPKNTFSGVSHINFLAINVKWTKWSQHLTYIVALL